MKPDLPTSRFQNLASLLRALGDHQALEILDKAKNGFKSGKATIKDFKLTPRQYYRKLRELNDLGIMMSIGDEYKLTQLGAFLHTLLLNDVSSLLLTNQNHFLPMEKDHIISKVALINDFNKLTDFLIATIDKSSSEILLATKYIDLTVMQRLMNALDRSVKVKTVTSSKVDLEAVIKLLGSAIFNIRPNIAKFLLSKNNYKAGDVPFSFIVIDNEIAVFEIPNAQFKSAFVFTDKQIVRLLAGLFWELWNKSETLKLFSPQSR